MNTFRLAALFLSFGTALPALAQRQRCGTPEPVAGLDSGGAPSDCGYLTNSPQPQYEPTYFYDIPVVFHVIRHNNGDGFLSAGTIRDQIDILNEDFQAIPGTPGGPGTNSRIRFHLATEDPQGNPTTGITYTVNNNWYNDSGNYWSSLHWDTSRYLNIYTNAPPCCYGYISEWASQGAAGMPNDRVVLWWEAVGRNPTPGWPLNMGRTASHEVGHYLGLYHTFCGGCGTSNCYGTGDLICDTERQSSATLGCPSSPSSCGSPDPFHNYMDYTDDPCLWEFTPEQVNRMRCTLEHWRPDVFRVYPPTELTRAGSPPNPAALLPGQTSGPRAGEVWDPLVDHTSFEPAATADFLLLSFQPTNLPGGTSGTLLCQPPFPLVTANLTPGTPFSIQIPNDPALLGRAFCVQAAALLPGLQVRMTNALDCIVGNG